MRSSTFSKMGSRTKRNYGKRFRSDVALEPIGPSACPQLQALLRLQQPRTDVSAAVRLFVLAITNKLAHGVAMGLGIGIGLALAG